MKHFCREASRLESDAFERRLRPVERFRLRFHLLLCGACRNYRQELRLMRQIFRRIRREQGDPGHGMSETERVQILDALQRVTEE